MSLEIFAKTNWVDIVIVIVSCRICYVAMRTGFSVEIFKFFGSLLSIYVSMHYYPFLSDFVGQFIKMEGDGLAFMDFISFMVLAVLGYTFFILMRHTFSRFIKLEAVPNLNKFGGLFLGMFRALFLSSLIIFGCIISTLDYMKSSVHSSFLGPQILSVAPNTYTWMWDNLMSKFMTSEKFNSTVLEAQNNNTNS